MYIPHARVNSECMFVSVDSVVLCNWLTASKTILLSASIVNKEYLVKSVMKCFMHCCSRGWRAQSFLLRNLLFMYHRAHL